MTLYNKNFKIKWLTMALICIAGVYPVAALALDGEAYLSDDSGLNLLPDSALRSSIKPTYGFDFQIITEGISNFPVEIELTNFIPFDLHLMIIVAIGWTGDKFTITIEDKEEYGDALTGVALAFYSGAVKPFWGNVFSGTSAKSFSIDIPVSSPGVVVALTSGYWLPSPGENPYQYNIKLSFPQ